MSGFLGGSFRLEISLHETIFEYEIAIEEGKREYNLIRLAGYVNLGERFTLDLPILV
jgi:hypothetical protein